MYRFKSGKLAGMTMQHAILKRGARLYGIATWAEANVETNPRFRKLVKEFYRLKNLLSYARIKVRCKESECTKPARWMTFEATYQGYLPLPDLWCDKHGPPEEWGVSERIRLGLEAMELFKTLSERKIVHREILQAWGICKGTRITEAFANHFFDALGR